MSSVDQHQVKILIFQLRQDTFGDADDETQVRRGDLLLIAERKNPIHERLIRHNAGVPAAQHCEEDCAAAGAGFQRPGLLATWRLMKSSSSSDNFH